MNSSDCFADRLGQFFWELDYITMGEKSSIWQKINRIPLDIEKKIVSNPLAYYTYLGLSQEGHMNCLSQPIQVKTCFISCANSRGPDQPAHMCRLVRASAVCHHSPEEIDFFVGNSEVIKFYQSDYIVWLGLHSLCSIRAFYSWASRTWTKGIR